MSSHAKFHVFSTTFFCFEMAPNILENGTQCCFNKFDRRLFISKFSQFAFYLSLSHSVISKSLAQPFCKCCSLSVSIVLNVRFAMNGMCVMNSIRVARTSRNKISTTWDLYCCLVPQCEGLRTCCSAFPIAFYSTVEQTKIAFPITTKWCFDQDVKMVPGTNFTKRPCNRCGLLKKRGMLLQPLGWRCTKSVGFACPIHENNQR